MSADVAFRYEDDTNNPVATITALVIEATGLTLNETQTEQNITDGVLAAPVGYYLTLEANDDQADTLRSEVFGGPAFSWPNVIVPVAGDYTAHIRSASDDSSVESTSLTADAP